MGKVIDLGERKFYGNNRYKGRKVPARKGREFVSLVRGLQMVQAEGDADAVKKIEQAIENLMRK